MLITRTSQEAVTVITLARGERRNALTPAMADELLDAIQTCPPSTRCVVLAGEGAMFCSGFDLSLCEVDRSGHTMRRLLITLSAVVRALRSQPAPVVVSAHGGAIAGGCAILGGADVVVGERDGVFGYPVVRLGVSPAVSSPTLMPAVGPGVTRRLQLDPGLVRGVEAHRVGLVHVLVDQAVEVMPKALEIAHALAAKPAEAMQATRRWLDEVVAASKHPVQGGSLADAGLAVSLSLVGGAEERAMLRGPTPKSGGGGPRS